ncbi:MAG: DUF4097 family beta strand repeat protein [Gammaproteobacteria bacterium AqS3]|nr:DUF4097 family beta strand repeat protein [Gammaproteobacteria bacterium AqS3]
MRLGVAALALMVAAVGVLPAAGAWAAAAPDDDPTRFGLFRHKSEFSRQLKAGAQLYVSGVRTEVSVSQRSRSTIRIQATLYSFNRDRLGQIRLETEETADGWRVAVRWPGGEPRRGERAELDIITPPLELLDVDVQNAEISIEKLRTDEVRLRTSNEEISVDELIGRLDARTSNAEIEVDDQQGDARLKTSNARIEVAMQSGGLSASTSNASIDAEARFLDGDESVELDTSNGSVELSVSKNLRGRIEAETSNGGMSATGFTAVNGTSMGPEGGFLQIGEDRTVRAKISTSNGRVVLRGE